MELIASAALIKRLFYLIAIAATALSLFNFLHYDQAAWVVWAMFAAANLIPDKRPLLRMAILLMSGLTAALMIILVGFLSQWIISGAVILILITMITNVLALKYRAYFFTLFTFNFFLVMTLELSHPLVQVIDNALLVFLSFSFVAVLQIIIWPYFDRDELKLFCAYIIRDLQLVNRTIFSCLLQEEYSKNIYYFEHRVHAAKCKYMESMGEAKSFAKKLPTPPKAANQWLVKFNNIYAILMDCAQLRRRVTDHTVFALCAEELSDITAEINSLLQACLSKTPLSTYKLRRAIKNLEDNYRNVIQVTAREPLVFLLFIFSLKLLADELNNDTDNLELVQPGI